MGRLIDESLLQEKLALIPMEERTFRRTVEELENAPTVEAIPKDQYETRLKADLKAILVELQLEIEENGIVDFEETYVDDGECIISVSECNRLIQEKINALKGDADET